MWGQKLRATIQGEHSKPITALGLRALTRADHGRTIRFGESMTGKVRVGRDGAISVHVSWCYRIGGKTREIRIGTWREHGGMSLKALRDERDKLATELRSGIDPIERKATERLVAEADRAEAMQQQLQRAHAAKAASLERQRRLTIRELFGQWVSTQLQPHTRADGKRTGRKDGGQYVREQFERHVFPKIGDMAVTDVRKADLLALLDVQKTAGKLRTANVLLADLKQMLDFALDRELIVGNPLTTVKKRHVGGASVKRNRHLDTDELSLMVKAVPTAGLQTRTATAIWLTLATGVRVGELMGAVWADALPDDLKGAKPQQDALQATANAEKVKLGIVNMAARTWYLPDTKNQRDHTIHLSEFALAQFKNLAALRERDAAGKPVPWVFPATDTRKPVSVKSFSKQIADRQRPPEARMKNRSKATTALSMPGGKWTPHDLRRTAATIMSKLGFSDDVINECHNHIKPGMSGVYNQDRREAQQALAFNALGARLAQIMSGDNSISNIILMQGAA